MLAAGERALHLAKLGKAELLGEVGIERDLRAAGVDEEVFTRTLTTGSGPVVLTNLSLVTWPLPCNS